MAIIRPSNLQTVMPTAAPATVGVNADIGAFGENQARQGIIAGSQLEKASDSLDKLSTEISKAENESLNQDLNNKFISDQQKLLFSGDNAFYRQKGDGAIRAAQPTVDQLLELKKSYIAQAGNENQRRDLEKRLSAHIESATDGISRHVASQAMVWRDTVDKGTILNATNDAVQNYNDPAKVALHTEGAWQTEYDRLLKITGPTPEGRVAAKAGADGVRSNILKAVITTLAVDNPTAAQRMLDGNRTKLDATDIPALSAAIKDADQKRKTQNIVGLVTATGGISPNYNAKVKAAEGGDRYTENKIGALGDYQMIPGTYTDLAQQTEWGKGKTQAEVRQMLLDPKEGGKRQDELKRAYDDRSLKALSDKGLPINDLTLYTTHFLGHAAGPEILKLPDDTPLQAGLLKAHGGDAAFVQKVIEANPFLAKVDTVGDLKALMAQKIGAPLSLASSGSPQKPNLDAMLASGLAMAGSDSDLRDRVTQAIKTDYATKHAIYTAQIGALEKQAFNHIDAGGTVETLPSNIRGGLDADGLTKVQAYEEKRIEKRRKENAEAASKGLAVLESVQQITKEDVLKQQNNLPANEFRSWMKTAEGKERTDDAPTYERLQRGLGTRDMRDDIFAAHTNGDISSEARNSLLDKNAAFAKEGAPATPYKIGHDYVMRSLDPGLMGSGISREIAGRGIKEYDQYVAANPQREGETPEAYAKRLDTFAADTVKRHSLISTQEMAISQPVPVHTPFIRGEMTALPKNEATKKIAAANADLAAKFQDGKITEDQYNLDAIALMGWLNFVQKRPEPGKTP